MNCRGRVEIVNNEESPSNNEQHLVNGQYLFVEGTVGNPENPLVSAEVRFNYENSSDGKFLCEVNGSSFQGSIKLKMNLMKTGNVILYVTLQNKEAEMCYIREISSEWTNCSLDS